MLFHCISNVYAAAVVCDVIVMVWKSGIYKQTEYALSLSANTLLSDKAHRAMRAVQTALSAVNACYHNNQLKLGCLLTSQVKGAIATAAVGVAQLMLSQLLYDITPFRTEPHR